MITFVRPIMTSKTGLLQSLLRLTRAWNLVIIVFAQYFTAWTLLGVDVFWDVRLFLLSLSTTLIAAGGYVINDYYDVKIDFVNNPDRVVVGKTVHRRFAILLHGLLSASGVLISIFLSWWIFAIHVFSVCLLWFYSNLLKRLPFIGNLAVALLTGVSLAVLNVLYASNNLIVIIYATFAFFMTLVREIIKDMEDLKGDNTFGCKTIPIIWGIRKTKIFIYVLIGVFSLIVFFINQAYVHLPVIYFVMLLFIPLVWLVAQLYRADTKKNYNVLSSFCKVIMLLGILSMALV